MKIHITENKSVGTRKPRNLVRVFVNEDYHYGYFVDENALLALLNDEERKKYLEGDPDVKLEVAPEVAQTVIDVGQTPYAKVRVMEHAKE